MCRKKSVLSKLPSLILFIMCIISSNTIYAQDEFIDLLEDELKIEMATLKKQENPPYYMNYRVDETYSTRISSSFGDLTSSTEDENRILTIMIRVGSNELDNFHELRDNYGGFNFDMYRKVKLPIENSADGIKQVIWKETDKNYSNAVTKLAMVKANVAVKVEEEDKSPDFSKEKTYTYYEPQIEQADKKIDRSIWEERIKKYSKPFLDDPSIFKGTASLSYKVVRKNFVSTEGSKICQNLTYAHLSVSGSIKADDGMVLPLYKSYFAHKPEDLPQEDEVLKDVKEIVAKLTKLKNAAVVEPYAGPAILTAGSAGVFFHEIFGHRIEGQRQKSTKDGQTFKKKVGEKVLPDHMSVIMDPTLKKYDNIDLNGYFQYDDQGIKGSKVTVVENGILKDFLMSRCPIENFLNSNGHGRAEPGMQPVARQSNLIVTTSEPHTMDELRVMLKEEAKKQGKKYGFLFSTVRGGFTMTGRFIPNSFNVMPLEVYRIYVDGRPDELVRGVDLVGTPLAMFSKIDAAGDKSEIFTGTCGAESGSIPVTGISPALFVKQIELQKKHKSQQLPIILPRPDSIEGNDIK